MADTKQDVEVKREPAETGGQTGSQTGAPQVADWEPLRALRHQLDRLMGDFDWPELRTGRSRRHAGSSHGWQQMGMAAPVVDLVERDGAFELQAELPGLAQNQIEIKLSDGMMTIKGEKSAEKIEDTDDYHLRERSFGSFQRSFRVPSSVDTDKIEARFENGVLKVLLPKSANAKEQERKIEVKSA